jgi:hypothetical protein
MRPRKIVIKSDDKRLVYGEVYAPLHVDTDDESMTREDIERAAHAFLSSGRVNKVDVQHNCKESGCTVVESFLARKNDPDGFIEGSWVLGVKVSPDVLWQQVKAGELNGFSFFGTVVKVPAKTKVVTARKIVGETENSTDGLLPIHFHSIEINFKDGDLLSGQTGEALDHRHDVKHATATERAMEHSHRLILVEN